MKTLIAAALLLALTGSANAAGGRNYNLWNCGSGIEATAGKHLGIDIDNPTSVKGSLNLRWDFSKSSPGKIWINGKRCKFVPDVEH